jgi:hypothetical protein
MPEELSPLPPALTRQQVYDLIWSEPVRKLASRFGVSDVAVAKLCRNHDIPLPPRGYWAKLAAGKKVTRTALPPRGLGVQALIHRGRQDTYYRAAPANLAEIDIGTPPTFGEPAESIIQRVREMVGHVTVPRDLSRVHPAIEAILKADDVRRGTYLASSTRFVFDAPMFDSPFEKRRLRFMNGLLRAFQRLGLRPSLYPRKDPTHIGIIVGHQHVGLRIDEPGRERSGWRTDKELTLAASTPLRVSLGRAVEGLTTAWQDRRDYRVEEDATEIVVSAMAAGELIYREQEIAHHRWLVERKQELIEERRRRQIEDERREHERLAALEKARIDQLLDEAARHRQANDIRAYVLAALATSGAADRTAWAEWARAQADILDPLVSGVRETF